MLGGRDEELAGTEISMDRWVSGRVGGERHKQTKRLFYEAISSTISVATNNFRVQSADRRTITFNTPARFAFVRHAHRVQAAIDQAVAIIACTVFNLPQTVATATF